MQNLPATFTQEDELLLPLTEPIAVPDLHLSGVAQVDELEPNLFRVTGYSKQRNVHDGAVERVVALRFIASGDTLDRIVQALANARAKQNGMRPDILKEVGWRPN